MFEIFLAGVFFFDRVKEQKNMDYLGRQPLKYLKGCGLLKQIVGEISP